MTVATEISEIRFTAIVDGVALPCPFPCPEETDVIVRYGDDVVATNGVDYDVTLAGDFLTFTVTPIAGFALLSGGTISVAREVPLVQDFDLLTRGEIGSSLLVRGLDYLTYICQQLSAKVDRTLRYPFSDPSTAIAPIPELADRAGKFFTWDADGKPAAASGATSTGTAFTAFGTAWAAFMTATLAMTSASGLGFSAYMESLKTTASLTLLQTALGMSTFFKTLLAAADATAFRVLISVYSIAQINALNSIAGWTSKPNAGTPASQIDISAGSGIDSTKASMAIGGAMTKLIAVAWAAGDAAGALDTGAIANADYDIYAIWGAAGVTPDYITVVSGNAPVLPATFLYKRKIGWFKRSGGSIVAFDTYETAGGGLHFAWRAPIVDVDLSNTLTTARRTDAVKVPLTFATDADLNILLYDGAADAQVRVCCPDETDAAPSTSDFVAQSAVNFTTRATIRTSVAGLIAARSTLATVDVYRLQTNGFRWSRR